LEPLLIIEPVAAPELDLDDVQALLATSANGARALAAADDRRDLPLFAVGDATAQAARAAGYQKIESAGGDVDDLARLIIDRLDPSDGAILHAAASTLAGDLAGHLGKAGFAYRRAILYQARARDSLSAETRRSLADGSIDGVLFFSPRTGSSFVTLAVSADLTEACGRLAAFCLSPAVADAIGSIDWGAVHIAEHPDQASLLARVDAVRQGDGND
jgi:uroporphyrinogen-III synthase